MVFRGEASRCEFSTFRVFVVFRFFQKTQKNRRFTILQNQASLYPGRVFWAPLNFYGFPEVWQNLVKETKKFRRGVGWGGHGRVLGTFSQCYDVFSCIFLRVAGAFGRDSVVLRVPQQTELHFFSCRARRPGAKLDLSRPVVKVGVCLWSRCAEGFGLFCGFFVFGLFRPCSSSCFARERFVRAHHPRQIGHVWRFCRFLGLFSWFFGAPMRLVAFFPLFCGFSRFQSARRFFRAV